MRLLLRIFASLLIVATLVGRCVAACPSPIHQTTLTDLALSHDATRIAAVAHDGTLFWWDTATGRRTQLVECIEDGGGPIVFSPDSSQIALKVKGVIQLFTLAEGAVAPFFGPKMDSVRNIVFSADGRLLAASDDKGVKVWNVVERKEIQSIPGLTEAFALALSRHGDLLLVEGPSGIDVWDLTVGRVIRTVTLNPLEHAEGVAFARGDRWIVGAVASALPIEPKDKHRRYKRYVTVWETKTGQKLKTIRGVVSELAHPLTVSRSGILFVSQFEDTLQAWDLGKGRLKGSWTTRPGIVSYDGRFLVRQTGYPGHVELWRIGTEPTQAKRFAYRSPLCESVSPTSPRFDTTIMGDGSTDDGYTFGFRNLVAQDCTQLGLSHYYFPTEERAKEELQREMQQYAGKVLEQGPPKGLLWEQGPLGERAVLQVSGRGSDPDFYIVVRTHTKDFFRLGSTSLPALLELERSFFSDPEVK
jgi:hypothetical protein